MDKQLVVLLVLIASAHAQILQGITLVSGTTASNPTPGFVSEASNNSSLANLGNWGASGTSTALGTKANNTCATDAYCLNYVDVALSGNLGVVCWQASSSPAPTFTVTDDKSDTYTTLTKSSADSSKVIDCAYSPNLTSGAHAINVATAVASTNVAPNAAMFYNINTSSPLDASTSCVGGSSTTANCGSVTTTTGNDLIYVFVCRTGTPLHTSSAAAGSGYTLSTDQYQDGCISEYKLGESTVGSITPTLTLGGASTYIEYILAFKSATAGTAPSGLYADKMQSWSSPNATAASYTLHLPNTAGSLLVDSQSCGGTTPTGISDSPNGTWTQAGSTSSPGGSIITGEWYVANAAANTSSVQTGTTTGTGDCTYTFYSFQGAATSSPLISHLNYTGSSSVNPNSIPDSTGLTSGTSNFGTAYKGVTIMTGGQQNNTSISLAPTNCLSDASTTGAENLDGPWPIFQNNPWGHCYFGTTPAQFKFTQTAVASSVATWGVDVTNFASPTSVALVNTGTNVGTSGTTLVVTPTSGLTSGNVALLVTGWYDGSTSRTVSSVKCNDGSLTAFTVFPSGTAAVVTGSIPGVSVYSLTSIPSGCTAVTVTYSGAITNSEAYLYEFKKYGGGSWTIDNGGNGANVRNQSASGSTASGPTLSSLTGAPAVCVAIVGVADAINGNPLSGNAWVYGGTSPAFANTSDAASSLITTLSSVQPKWHDSGATGAFSAAAGCAK